MKLSGAIAMSLACALAGFFGGRLSQGSSAEGASGGKSGAAAGGANGSPGGTEATASAAKGSGKRSNRGSSGGKKQGPLADALRDIVASWNDQNLELEDGSNSELLLFDLGKLSHIMSSLEKTTEADITELKDVARANDDSSEDAAVLEALVALPLLGRDIQLRGSRALDAEIERALEDPMETEVEEILPIMIYSLALQNPAEAEAWLEGFSKRPEAEDLLIDEEELKAAIEKAKQSSSASK